MEAGCLTRDFEGSCFVLTAPDTVVKRHDGTACLQRNGDAEDLGVWCFLAALAGKKLQCEQVRGATLQW